MSFYSKMGILFCGLLMLTLANAELLDPTRPTNSMVAADDHQTEAATDKLVLSAILHSAERNIAVINGQLLRVGDTIKQYRVTAIDANSVKLSATTGVKELSMLDSIKSEVEPVSPQIAYAKPLRK